MKIYKVLYVALCIVCETETPVQDRISWNLLKKPAVFTRDVQLECTISTEFPCCNEFTRKWSRGRRYDLVVMNGVSLNTAKYKENLNISANTSTLTIYKFSEYDVDIPYECSYGFDSASHILELTEENFEYHPEEMLPYNLTLEGHQVVLNITLMKVYPAPICTAMDGDIDVTDNLIIKNDENGLFLRSNLRFNYTINYVCHTTVEISCRIGQTKFAIVNYSRPCIKEKYDSTVSLVTVRVMIIVCSIVIIFYITVLLRMNYRLHVKRNKYLSTKTDGSNQESKTDDRNNDDTNVTPQSVEMQRMSIVQSHEGMDLEPAVKHNVQHSQPLLQSVAKEGNIDTRVVTNKSRKKKKRLKTIQSV
ncbi:uncharacterized protein LOC143059069 [Mytilus galloprovincialis]|uniref:uncharacterized protein LOC143059069 n=1 Tax=Mytilus galloprovincialis TaxID=29158 RepID=UPI003F7BE132